MKTSSTIDIVAEQFALDGASSGVGSTPPSGYPSPYAVAGILRRIIALLFPRTHALETDRIPDENAYRRNLSRIACSLKMQIEKALHCNGKEGDFSMEAVEKTESFLAALPNIKRMLREDIQAAYEGDPAASSTLEVILAYPGLYAVCVHRVAHALHVLKVPVIPRMMSEDAHSRTGIDIHPGATIGDRFFIDHGTGVVIGETAVIGRNVKLYQGVTLGALSFQKDETTGMLVKNVKRHPNVEDDVVIYAGATILGGKTTIGRGSTIGGNVWLTKSVPPNSCVYNKTPAPMIVTAK